MRKLSEIRALYESTHKKIENNEKNSAGELEKIENKKSVHKLLIMRMIRDDNPYFV